MNIIDIGTHKLILDDGYSFPLIRIRKNRNTFYATSKGFFIHRLVMNAEKGQIIDHINGNGLDNRKENLRFCTTGQNRQRATSYTQKSKSGYRGVCKHGRGWKATIWVNNKWIYIGSFSRPEEAARAYDRYALNQFGQHARTNF